MPKLAKTELRLVAQELGLIESTNNRQERNGTMAFVDPVMSTQECRMSYTVHSNGYIRRKFEYANPTWYRNVDHYQLNRTQEVPRIGSDWTRSAKRRIMATPLEQVAILFKSTINFRKRNNNK